MTGWIKCSDQLPEEEHPVLAFWTNGSGPDEMDVMTLERAGDGELMWWNNTDGSHSFDLVEYWIPLPSPPEKEEDQ